MRHAPPRFASLRVASWLFSVGCSCWVVTLVGLPLSRSHPPSHHGQGEDPPIRRPHGAARPIGALQGGHVDEVTLGFVFFRPRPLSPPHFGSSDYSHPFPYFEAAFSFSWNPHWWVPYRSNLDHSLFIRRLVHSPTSCWSPVPSGVSRWGSVCPG